LRQEHVIYPRAVRWFVDNRLSIEGDRVVVTPSEPQLIESLEH
jgi:phosphoribosylglycinamide formyltransferase-1